MAEEKNPQSEVYGERLTTELDEVNARFIKLDAFILSDDYGVLHVDDRMLLTQQWRHMDSYIAVLKRRIERYEARK